MIRKVWYMILVLITVYVEIMYVSTWMLAMLAFELLLAAVMILMLTIMHRASSDRLPD